MSKIICIANQKGGVAKTTTAFNVGASLSQNGKKVLLVDFDGQANLSSYLGFVADGKPTISDLLAEMAAGNEIDRASVIRRNEAESIDYIPSNLNLSSAEVFLVPVMCREQILRRILKHPIFDVYDYIIIDCLPSLGVLLTNALAASDSLVVPVQTQPFAMDGLEALFKSYNTVKAFVNPDIELNGILPTIVENTSLAEACEKHLRDTYGELVYTTKIKKATEVAESTYTQKSIISIKNSKRGAEYIAATNEIIERIK